MKGEMAKERNVADKPVEREEGGRKGGMEGWVWMVDIPTISRVDTRIRDGNRDIYRSTAQSRMKKLSGVCSIR